MQIMQTESKKMNDVRTQMLERIGEDESLVGNLQGEKAIQLRQWASTTAESIAQREDLDDRTVASQLNAIRTAARTAAANGGDVTLAQATFATLVETSDQTVVGNQPPVHLVTSPPQQWWHRFTSFWAKSTRNESK